MELFTGNDTPGLRKAYLGLGSNLGDRAANLLRALKEIRDAGLNLTAISSIYETGPVDYLDQPDFLNMAVAVSAPLIEPFSLLSLCRHGGESGPRAPDPERRARDRHRSAAL